VDTVNRQTRSRIMASVPQRNSKPEVCLRRELFRRGYRYRLHVKSLPGTPDVVLPKFKLLIFIHGCFWHRHSGCRLTTNPSTRSAFWNAKFLANVQRDDRKRLQLRKLGWKSVVVWQCEIQRSTRAAADKIDRTVNRVIAFQKSTMLGKLRSVGRRRQGIAHLISQ
jgi:DNA mismatch endonuclease, patch repair protein